MDTNQRFLSLRKKKMSLSIRDSSVYELVNGVVPVALDHSAFFGRQVPYSAALAAQVKATPVLYDEVFRELDKFVNGTGGYVPHPSFYHDLAQASSIAMQTASGVIERYK